jgi:hypothetical protein
MGLQCFTGKPPRGLRILGPMLNSGAVAGFVNSVVVLSGNIIPSGNIIQSVTLSVVVLSVTGSHL